MTRFQTALVLMLPLAGPAFAMGDAPPPPQRQAPPEMPAPRTDAPRTDAPASDFGSGIEDFMRNMLTEAQPHLNELGRNLGGLVGAVSPVLSDIADLMDDARNYQAPERLENGDILIRRRADAPPPPPVGPALQDMMRHHDQDAPPALRPKAQPDAPRPLPERDPASEVEL